MLNGVMTIKEATMLWGLGASTLRVALNAPFGKYKELVEGIDYNKSHSEWLITEAAMIKLYGERV